MFFLNFLKKEIKPLFGSTYKIGRILLYLSVILFILYNNLQGLIRYTFVWTSQLLLSLSLRMSLWFSILLQGVFKNLKKNLTHLVPTGTPFILIRFIILVESLRIFIRPITLSVRLAANITAGHLLLRLISWNNSFVVVGILIQLLIFVLEIIVAIIQSYVFIILLILYTEEEN